MDILVTNSEKKRSNRRKRFTARDKSSKIHYLDALKKIHSNTITSDDIYIENLNKLKAYYASGEINDTEYKISKDMLWSDFKHSKTISKKTLEHPWNIHRVCKCGKVTISDEIHVGLKNDNAVIRGLFTCGSVWSCPVCAAKIQEARRKEIAKAIKWAYLNDYKCIMITMTISHKQYEKLGHLMNKFTIARQKLKGGNPWKRLKESAGLIGYISTLELTFGEINGWHPHYHELWIVKKDCDTDLLRDRIADRWTRICLSQDLIRGNKDNRLDKFNEKSIDIRDNVSSSEYLTKQSNAQEWGIDREMAKSSSKVAKNKGYTPFQLLDKSDNSGTDRYAKLFMEFCNIFKGRKQHYWSRGLKELINIEEKTEEELSEEKQPEILLYVFSQRQFSIVTKNNMLIKIIEWIEDRKWNNIQKFFIDNHTEIPEFLGVIPKYYKSYGLRGRSFSAYTN